MAKFAQTIVGLLFLGCAIGTASAAVIYDGGPPDQGGTYFGDRSSFVTDVAVPFQLQPGLDTVSDVHWWGGCFTGPDCPAGNFILSFYSDNAGTPGVLIQSFAVGNANQAATGNQIFGPFTEYQYSAFVGPLAFAPLTQFWLGISNDTAGVGGQWGLETTSDPNAPPFHAQFITIDFGPPFVVGWNVLPPALAFNLTNDAAIPEPATLALLGLGLAGLAATRRRMR